MRSLAIFGTTVLVLVTLTSCADPFANATATIEVTGQTEIVGESVEITVNVDGVSAAKVLTIEEQLSGGEWVVLETFTLAESELSASLTDVIDETSTVAYRALLRPSADAEAVFETPPVTFAPLTLEQYVDQNLTLALEVINTPDDSGLFFDGDEVGVAIDSSLGSGLGLETALILRYEGATSQQLFDSSTLESNQIDWSVELDSADAEAGELVLEALITGAAGQVSRTQTLGVRLANPLMAFELIREEVIQLSSNNERREVLIAAAGDVFLDQTSRVWQEGLGVQIVFDEPFLGEVMAFESSSGFEVPSACAPGGMVNSFALAGRSFVIEVDMANYTFNETLFGNFDGEQLTFSAAWKFCLG